MKKFYKNILLFLAPIVLLLLLLPINRTLKYEGLKGDCEGHGIWTYLRIFENTKPVDLAFIGSSHTISGVNDALIESAFDSSNMKVANFGYCRLGRNFSYALLKEILKNKQPKYIILEVREDEDRYSHPIFPYVASTKDVIFPELLFNRDIISDISAHLSYKVELSQDFLYKGVRPLYSDKGEFGFGTTNDTTAIEIMEEARLKRGGKRPAIENLERNFYLKYPRAYLKKIKDLCTKQNIQLSFLYIPSFGSTFEYPNEINTYMKYGKVLIPPNSIFENTNYWHDTEHLNPAGSEALSKWLIEQLKDKIIE